MTVLRKLWLPFLVIALLAAWLAYATSRPRLVETQAVTRGSIRSFVEEEGKTRVLERYLVSATIDGRLRRVLLEPGDAVKRGQVVAVVDPLALKSLVDATEARARRLQREAEGVDTRRPKAAELERARVLAQRAREDLAVAQREAEASQAEAEQATKEAERLRKLSRQGSATTEEAERAQLAEIRAAREQAADQLRVRIRETDVRTADLETSVMEARVHDFDWQEAAYKEQLAEVKAELTALRDDLTRTQLTSPCDGVVLQRLHQSETYVRAGEPVLEIGDVAALEVEADFLSEDAARMQPGMTAELFGRALGDRVQPARVVRVHPSAFEKISSLGVEQQRVRVVIGFDPVPGLGDQFRVDVRVVLETRQDAVLVPEGALFRSRGNWKVFRVQNGRAQLTQVQTGLSDGHVREVIDGLSAQDKVVLHPPGDLEDGSRVDVLE